MPAAIRLAACLVALAAAGATRASIDFDTRALGVATPASCLAAADIDGDGDADPVLAGTTLAWLESAGTARRFEARELRAALPAPCTALLAADIDADGDPDLAMGDSAGLVRWYRNPRLAIAPAVAGDPTDGAAWSVHEVGAHGAAIADLAPGFFDSDGSLDLVAAGNARLTVLQQHPGAPWTTVDLSALSGAGVAAGDLDGDGDFDLATAGGWIENPGTGLAAGWQFWPIALADPGSPALALLDVNRDGRPDIVTAKLDGSGSIAWLQAPSAVRQTNWLRRVVDSLQGSRVLVLADLDGDDLDDLVTTSAAAGLAVYLNRDIFGWDRVGVAPGAGALETAGDFDRDGRVDLVAGDSGGALAVHWNLGGGPGGDRVLLDGYEGL